MKCPHCGYKDSKVLDSRDVDDGVRRGGSVLVVIVVLPPTNVFKKVVCMLLKKTKEENYLTKINY